MKSVRSRRLRAVGLFIVILAMVLTVYSNWKTGKNTDINTRETDKLYDELANNSKIRIDLNVKSMDELKNLIATQLDAKGAVKLSSDEQDQLSTYIYQVKPEYINPILAQIPRIGTIASKSEKKQSSSSDIDLEAKLTDREAMYHKAFQDYTNSTSRSVSQKEKIDDLQAEIDSLKYQIANQKNTDMTLLYLRARVDTQHGTRIEKYKEALFSFGRYLLFLTLGIAVLYFGTVLLAYVFGILGVKFPTLNSIIGRNYNDYAGYKGYRGYGSYGYGGSKKRKIKRIYRNKAVSHSEAEEQKEDDN